MLVGVKCQAISYQAGDGRFTDQSWIKDQSKVRGQ